jgi:hypothetical protein
MASIYNSFFVLLSQIDIASPKFGPISFFREHANSMASLYRRRSNTIYKSVIRNANKLDDKNPSTHARTH